jgi:hypothetical protein
LVRGVEDDYAGRHPGAADVLCVIEVADASLRRDRGPKLAVYANNGIENYFIINLPDRVIECYSGPVPGKGSYRHLVTLTRRDKVELPAGRGKRVVVPVKQLLPS